MPFNNSIVIETSQVGRENLADFLDVLHGCWKCSSLLWLQLNGFPVLEGLILSGWSQEAEAAISRFCRVGNFSELLVRIEKPGQRWTRRRGGYTIPVSEARRQIEELEAEGMIAILLEPASPLRDMFSLATAGDLKTGKIDVELVGPGFDASDILRADVLPHERLELFFESSYQKNATPSSIRTKRLYVVAHEDYLASVQQRLAKIGAKLRNPSFPDEVMGDTVSGPDRRVLIEEATHFLKASGQTALLNHGGQYEPIPSRLLSMFREEFLRLFEKIKESKIQWPTLSLASSFLPQERLVIWDFFPPGENDTRILSRL